MFGFDDIGIDLGTASCLLYTSSASGSWTSGAISPPATRRKRPPRRIDARVPKIAQSAPTARFLHGQGLSLIHI